MAFTIVYFCSAFIKNVLMLSYKYMYNVASHKNTWVHTLQSRNFSVCVCVCEQNSKHYLCYFFRFLPQVSVLWAGGVHVVQRRGKQFLPWPLLPGAACGPAMQVQHYTVGTVAPVCFTLKHLPLRPVICYCCTSSLFLFKHYTPHLPRQVSSNQSPGWPDVY